VTRPPPGVNLIALSTRFRTTCSRRIRSPFTGSVPRAQLMCRAAVALGRRIIRFGHDPRKPIEVHQLPLQHQ
jgi:hypothetical protein